MYEHDALRMATDMHGYFCDPEESWQRGATENANRLLRQHFPKKPAVAGQLNTRRRTQPLAAGLPIS
ncbi:hypothetical protein GWR20_22775 [Mycolicibacter kumamotonensis]|uniref:IS30 family transposase n=1 Tax=Mycolicibacter kumamotonensis TaxID=354243 RepID=A0A7K3LHS9_9MYCO|nr:hypothetical protein [Mycolicibacter kumamotonensis]